MHPISNIDPRSFVVAKVKILEVFVSKIFCFDFAGL